MMTQRRLVNSADTIRNTTGQSLKIRKRVRFLDQSFAQELIRRDRARLEEKIKSLRQVYDFRQTVSGNGEAAMNIEPPQTPQAEQQQRNSYKVQGLRKPSEDEDNNSSKKTKERTRRRMARHGSLSAERLAELSKPRSKSGTLPTTNSSRRNAIVTASPEHLKLSIPERAPRTIPQLKHLSEDEVDYMVQPKTVQEFQQLIEISFPPSKILRQNLRGRDSRSTGNTHQQQSQYSSIAMGIKNRDKSNMFDPALIDNNANNTKPRPTLSKPSFKMAALGALSMKTQEWEELSPKSNQTNTSDLFTKSLPPKLTHHRARPLTSSFDMQPDVPNGRILRLRPRKSAWLELRMKERQDTTDGPPQHNRADEPEVTASPEPHRDGISMGFTSSLKYHKWTDKKAVDVDELTKNLSRCSYLRGTDEEMDIRDVFAR